MLKTKKWPLTYIHVYGNVAEGFTFAGPFKKRGDAVAFGKKEWPDGGWTVAEMHHPREPLEGPWNGELPERFNNEKVDNRIIVPMNENTLIHPNARRSRP